MFLSTKGLRHKFLIGHNLIFSKKHRSYFLIPKKFLEDVVFFLALLTVVDSTETSDFGSNPFTSDNEISIGGRSKPELTILEGWLFFLLCRKIQHVHQLYLAKPQLENHQHIYYY